MSYAPMPTGYPFYLGKAMHRLCCKRQIAIVGSRKASPHGRQVAYDFAYYLSEQGFFINSWFGTWYR